MNCSAMICSMIYEPPVNKVKMTSIGRVILFHPKISADGAFHTCVKEFENVPVYVNGCWHAFRGRSRPG